MAARGDLGLRAHEQAAMLELLRNDPDPEIARLATESLGVSQTGGAEPEAASGTEDADEVQDERSILERIAAMTPVQKLQLAMRGGREARAILIRDSNRMIAMAVLSSPKITDSEIENVAKMTNVSEDILRVIGHTRAWVKNYAIVSALARNSKTPIAISLNILPRLMEKDVKGLTNDRNVPDVLRQAARKRLVPK